MRRVLPVKAKQGPPVQGFGQAAEHGVEKTGE